MAMIENEYYTAADRMDDGPRCCEVCGCEVDDGPRCCEVCGCEVGDAPRYSFSGLHYCAACLRYFVNDLSDDELAEAVGAEKEPGHV